MDQRASWENFKKHLCPVPNVGLVFDGSRMGYDAAFIERMRPAFAKAFEAMSSLEQGAIANPDEKRQVGHYWLRDPSRAPTEDIKNAISGTLERIRAFARDVHAGMIPSPSGKRFTDLLVVGIGGSALGPQLASRALGG